jgi:hypothetical protein
VSEGESSQAVTFGAPPREVFDVAVERAIAGSEGMAAAGIVRIAAVLMT